MRGTSVTGFHYFQGCAPGATVTIWTGFTAAECELLRIRYASLARADPASPYAVPYLCNSNDCNGAVGTSIAGASARLGGGGAGNGAASGAGRAGVALLLATALALAAAAA